MKLYAVHCAETGEQIGRTTDVELVRRAQCAISGTILICWQGSARLVYLETATH